MVRAGALLLVLVTGCAGAPSLDVGGPTLPSNLYEKTVVMHVYVCDLPSAGCVGSREGFPPFAVFRTLGEPNATYEVEVQVDWEPSSPSTERLAIVLYVDEKEGVSPVQEWTTESPLETSVALHGRTSYGLAARPTGDPAVAVEQSTHFVISGPIRPRD